MSGTRARTSSAAAPVTSVRDGGMLALRLVLRLAALAAEVDSLAAAGDRRRALDGGDGHPADRVDGQLWRRSGGRCRRGGRGAGLVPDGDDPGQDRERHL